MMIPIDGSKRLVLHIGFHKTGTSALQEALYAARVAMRAQGVIYPQPISPHPSHLDLASSLGFNPRSGELADYPPELVLERYRRLVEDSPAGSTIVISSEEFCQGGYRTGAVAALQAFLQPLDVAVRIVAFVRDPLQFLLSIYHHEIRDTETTTRFEDWLGEFEVGSADFEQRLRIWRHWFDDVQVRDFENLRASGTSVVTEFLDAADLSEVVVRAPDRRVNAGVHPRLVEAYIAVRSSELDPATKQRLLNRLLEIGSLLAPMDGATFHLGAEGRARISARLARMAGAAPAALQPG